MSAICLNKSIDSIYLPDNSLDSERCFTSVRIKRVALYALSLALMTASVAIIGLSVTAVVTWPLALISIPLIAIAVGLVRYSRSFKDYENPRELQRMRNKALLSSFSQIFKEHGLCRVQKHQIVSPLILQEKFIKEYQFSSFSDLIRKYTLHTIRTHDLMPLKMLQKSFAKEIQTMGVNSFLSTFSLKDLSQHGIIPEKQVAPLHRLCDSAQALNAEFQSNKVGLDRKYPDRQERLLAQLDEEAFVARQNAARLKREMSEEARAAGYLTTEIMARPYYHRGAVDYNRSIDARTNGLLLTEFTAVPMVQNMADRMLNSELEAIQRRRQSILDRKTGEVDQVRYHEELKKLESARISKFQALDHEFRSIQAGTLKEVNL